MRSVNQAMVLGNLTRDPELRYTPQGNPVISFGVATNRYWRNEAGEPQEAVDFHNIVFWGKSAEIISQYVSKGDKIFVQGRLQTRDWEGKDGVKRRATEIVGRDFILLTPKKTGELDQKVEQAKEILKEPEPTDKPKEKNPVKASDIPF